MRILRTRLFRILPALAVGFLVFACKLSRDEDGSRTLSFTALYDSLKQYDSVVITLKDPDDGHTLDVAFEGKVRLPGDLEKRETPHWDGGKVIVVIEGYDAAGNLVYRLESGFDGRGDRRDSTHVFLRPGMGLGFPTDRLILIAGDSLAFPPITVSPADLADKRLLWSSSAPDVVEIGSASLRGRKGGTAQVTARMAVDTSKSLTLRVAVYERMELPEGLALSEDTLHLIAQGPLGRLKLSAIPSSASKEAEWTADKPAIATVTGEGIVQGLKAGATWVRVRSLLKPALTDSALVAVADPVPPERVVFSAESAELYVGGASESLMVSVLPPQAGQQVEFSVSAETVVRLESGRIRGLSAGDALIIARAKGSPSLTDTLKVQVRPGQAIAGVALDRKSLLLYTGGEAIALNAAIEPSGLEQRVQWRSGDAAIAKVDRSGRVSGVAPGRTRIYAISQADSTRRDSADAVVRTDMPRLSVGRADTTVAAGSVVSILPLVAPQEYGVLTAFKWDIDGAPGWDDSSASVKSIAVECDQEKEYLLRFYVRDTEGNEAIAVKKVNAVTGPVVNIVSPQDGASVNRATLKIIWTLDGKEQETGTDTVLKEGANVITRSARDGSGKVFSSSVTVYLDTTPPAKPLVKGGGGIASAFPIWTWTPGGGGSGFYRVAIDSESFDRPAIRDTAFTPDAALEDGLHTLYVQEGDAAGNWSLSGKSAFKVDRTGPAKPILKLNVASPTNQRRPSWTWSTGGNGGAGRFQSRLDNVPFPSDAGTADTAFIPAALSEGTHVLSVRERDSLGNWSEPAAAPVTVDTTPPAAPKVFGATPTNQKPRWSWISGGGAGIFRFKLGGDPTGAPESRDTAFELAEAVSKTTYSLSIQERDEAGNWSPVATFAITFDRSKPMVAFTAPQISGLFLTSSAKADLAGTAALPQGAAGSIRTVAYTLDGTAGTVPLEFDGTKWSIKALPLSNGKTITVKVTATDAAGNQGDASLDVRMDNTAPGAPSFTLQPPSVVNKADARTSLQWTWERTGEATDSFVVKLNGTEVARQAGASYRINAVTDGTYRLEVSERDLAGNASPFAPATAVLVDRVAPDAPVISLPPTPTRNGKPTWTWGAGAGDFEYRLAAGADPVGAGTPITASSYTPAANLADGVWYLQARERDGAGNWSAWSASGIIAIKSAAPAAPSVSRNASPTNAPKWTWVSGGGGNGTFRYRWNGNSTYLGEGAFTEYAPNLAEGTFNLCVSERDAIGFGAESCTSLVVDRTAPVVQKIWPPDGFITNKASLDISFEKDGSPASFRCDLVNDASKVCSLTVSDAAGNATKVSRTVWYRSNVLFVKAGGAGDGSSWESAATLDSVLLEGKNLNREVWVAAGDYSTKSIDYFHVGSGMKLYGGFSSSGYPNNSSQRDPQSNPSIITKRLEIGDVGGPSQDVVVDGFSFTVWGHITMWDNSLRITIRNCSFINLERQPPAAVDVRGTDIKLENLVIKNNPSLDYGAINIFHGSGNVEIIGGDFRNNWATVGSAIMIYDGNVTIRNNAVFLGNSAGGMPNQITMFGGNLDISGCQIQDGKDGISVSESATLVYGQNVSL